MSSPHPVGGPWSGSPSDAPAGTGWSNLLSDMDTYGVRTPVTTDAIVGPWAAAIANDWAGSSLSSWPFLPFEVRTGHVPAAFLRMALLVVDSGVAVEDLYAVTPVVVRGKDWFPRDAAQGLFAAMKDSFADDSVRDAVGWLLTNRNCHTGAVRVDVLFGMQARRAQWAEVGLGAGGWLYASAGFSPAEARAGLDAGTLDEGQARTMAALRGARLPVR